MGFRELTGWVPVARSAEVGRTVLVRRLPGGPVLLWRTRSGRPVAMAAVCPHRPVVMDDARLVGDALECPRHGRRYGPTGACLSRPDTAPVRTFTAREADGQIWLLSR